MTVCGRRRTKVTAPSEVFRDGVSGVSGRTNPPSFWQTRGRMFEGAGWPGLHPKEPSSQRASGALIAVYIISWHIQAGKPILRSRAA